LVLASFGAPASAVAAGPPLDDAAPRVVLYTGGPGADVFEAFGHVALCLGPAEGAGDGWCADYGTAFFTDFAGLMWGFLRGQAEFQVLTTPEAAVLARLRGADRTIWRQELPLTPEQARAVAWKLREDTRDPKWRYTYDHFRDNCATRVRDIIDRAVGGAWHAATAGRPGPGTSYRDLGRRRFGTHATLLPPVDLLVGRAADAIPDRWESMFMPDLLRTEAERFFGVAPAKVYTRRGPDLTPDPGWGGRAWFLVLGIVFAVPLAAARRFGRWTRAATLGAVVPLTLLALIVWGMAVISTLPAIRWNEMLLVLLPFDLALVFLPERARRVYALARVGALVLVALLLAAGVLRQPLWAPLFVPLLPMLVLAFIRPRPRSAARGRRGRAGSA
jgi:hypothetical protein